jgi:ketosteroid isomerase-like protein
MAALEPHLKGADRVREVFARMCRGDAAAAANLYAEDGRICFSGGEAQGRVAITGFYQRATDNLHPQPRVEDIFEKASRYVAIVDVPNDKGRTRAADMFELGEDGIRQLDIFSMES